MDAISEIVRDFEELGELLNAGFDVDDPAFWGLSEEE